MDNIRWGVVGAGGIANSRTLPVVGDTKHCVLSAVMDVQGADQLGEKYGVDATASLEDILARDDVDAVYIASPVQFHAEQVIAAARAGKHVLCEKPLARTLSESESMVEASLDAGVLLREAYMLRHHEAHTQIARLLQEAAIGQVVWASIQWAFDYPPDPAAWRQVPELGGGGVLMDIGCHSFDLLQTLLGPVSAVACRADTVVHDYQVEDLATTLLDFESGVQASVVTSFCLPPEAMPPRLDLYGTKGAIHAEGTLSQELGGDLVLCTSDGSAPVQYVPANAYARQIDAFAEAVMAGEVLGRDAADAALGTMRIVDAAYRSARSGECISL